MTTFVSHGPIYIRKKKWKDGSPEGHAQISGGNSAVLGRWALEEGQTWADWPEINPEGNRTISSQVFTIPF